MFWMDGCSGARVTSFMHCICPVTDDLVLGGPAAAFINADAAAAAAAGGAAGHDLGDMASSEEEPESDDDAVHGHHEFEDELLPEEDLHLLPPQLQGAHHAQQVSHTHARALMPWCCTHTL